MTSHTTQTIGPDAGSNAGRGFRYQDLVGSLFVTRMYLGDANFDAIVPEGSDDYEIHGAHDIVIVDTKSNRPEARQRSEITDATSFQKLWARPLTPGTRVAEYWLVAERARSGGVVTGKYSARELFPNDAPANSDASFVVIEPDPLQTATELLTTRRGITPLAAELIVIAFARTVGDLASANGPRSLEQRAAITPGDAERIAARVLAAVDADRLEALLRSGFLSTVDFLTSLEDAGFYLGVDVQPGHFAAGLAIERPEEAARIAEALERNGAVVIRGPSGAGKSGLMWNTVLATREGRRWFRVNTAITADANALTAFFQAYGNVAIGFVVDDVGRGGIEAWTALRLQCRTHTQAVVIGSIRSEDATLLPDRHTIAEIDAGADDRLARALWERLRGRSQTQWPGWNEPWRQSQGLLLEYGHILTAGARLDAIILDQIRTRLRQERDDELAILGASALATANGGSVLIERLRRQLGLNAGDMARALSRLIAEHLVRVDASGSQLSGLHSLRAASISSALTQIGYSTLTEQAKQAVAVTNAASLEKVIAGLVASDAISIEVATEAALARLAGKSAPAEVIAIVRGLRVGAETLTVRSWLATLPAAGIARKFATATALMGSQSADSVPDIGGMRMLTAHGNRLHSSVATLRIPAPLATALIAGLRESAERLSTTDIVDALSALARIQLTPPQRSELAAFSPAFDDTPIVDIVRILDAAESIDLALSSTWTGRANHTDLLQRLAAETPFALPIKREMTDDGLVVYGDIYEAAIQSGEKPNDILVAHVHSIMRLEPRAARAHVLLLDMSGTKSLHLDSEKRMPRENAPPKALVQTNRRVLDLVATEVAMESWSHYLMEGEQLLNRGLRALQRLLDSATVGRLNQQALTTLNEVIGACDNLVAPPGPPDGDTGKNSALSGRHLTPLQNLVFSCNATLVVRLAKLPDGAGALATYAADLVKQGDDAKQEPWALVRDGPPNEIEQAQHLLRKIELIALEAAASRISPGQRWLKAGQKPKGAFDFVARCSQEAFRQRIEARRVKLSKIVAREIPGVTLIGPTPTDGIMWQTRFVATFPLSTLADFKNWIGEAQAIGERLRTKVENGEDIALIPILNGHAALNYAYQLSCGAEHSVVAPMLRAIGHSSLLTAPDQLIVDRIDAPAIRHPIQFERVFSALGLLSSMHQLALGGPERPSAERDLFELAFSDLSSDGPLLLEIFDEVEHPAIGTLRSLINLVLFGDDSEALAPSVSLDGIQDALVELTWRRSQALH